MKIKTCSFAYIIVLTSVFVLFSCKESYEETIPDVLPPIVTSTNPVAESMDFPISDSISATFVEEIDPAGANIDSFSLSKDGNTVLGSVTVNGKIVTLIPDSALEKAVTYTATLTTAMKDTSQNTLEQDYSWSFESTRHPSVSEATPTLGSERIALRPEIKVAFSEKIESSSINTDTFFISDNDSNVEGRITYSDSTAIFIPTNDLLEWTTYTVIVTTGVKDLAGNQMEEEFTSTFKTTDKTAPEVSSISLDNNTTGVALDATIAIVFNDDMDTKTMRSAIMLIQDGNIVDGSVIYDNKIATFTPDQDLIEGKTYMITIKTDAKNEAGVGLQEDISSNFTTVNIAPINRSISINSGVNTTDSTAVTLRISATDNAGVTAYYSSETSTTPTAANTGWTTVTPTINYSADISFTLSKGNGSKTVYVWFKDAAGNVSESANESITLTIITTFDSVANLTWQDNGSTTTMNWTQNDLCQYEELDGKTDWRRPTSSELLGLYSRRDILNEYSTWYWTSEGGCGTSCWATAVSFGSGTSTSRFSMDQAHQRCVRDGQ